jgi:hypothetical protein
MFSGIASLEWKWVKNAGQHLMLLFTGTQKTANFACHLCKIGWEKHPRAFLRVVGIKRSTTFLLIIWCTSVQIFGVMLGQTGLVWVVSAPGTRARARRRSRRSTSTAPRLCWARTLRPVSARRSMRAGTLPRRTAFPILSPRATRLTRTGRPRRPRRPPSGVAVVLRAHMPPCRAHTADVSTTWRCANRLARSPIKGQEPRSRATSRARPPEHRRRHYGCCQRRAPMPTRSPCCLAFQVSPLDTVVGPAAACCLGLTAGSPEHPPPRPPTPDSAAHALRSSPRRK